jgi:hypothetical protein
MKICNFVQAELQVFRDKCNFTEEELQFFEYRAKDKSIVQIAQRMHISESKASVLSNKVKKKIMKVV